MSPHNKRSMAQKKANKERVANFHARRSTNSGGWRGLLNRGKKNGAGNNTSSNNNNKRHTHKHVYGAADPLDCQLFDYIIVIDVEATCEYQKPNYPHEIIELPGVLIDVRRGIVDKERSFQSYVKPWRNPILSDFCTKLTGITQNQVDAAPSLPEVVKRFEKWFRETIPFGAKVVLAADGPWDFKNFIYAHSILRDNVSFPDIFYEYLDIRTTFAHEFNRGAPIKLDAMLRSMRLKFEGRPHCGFDDSVNIARLALAMMRAGCIFDFLISIPMVDDFHYPLDGYPLYRREEGSGKLDPDVVDDIAKSAYGMEYFRFGEKHREEVLKYREEHPTEFSGVSLQQQDACMRRRQMTLRWKLLFVCVLALAVLGMLIALFIGKKHKVE